jgi:hypothetical protein
MKSPTSGLASSTSVDVIVGFRIVETIAFAPGAHIFPASGMRAVSKVYPL